VAEEYHGPDRRAAPPVGADTNRWRAEITSVVEVLKAQQTGMVLEQAKLAGQVEHNTKVTEEIKKNTDEIVGVFKAIQGWITVAGWLGKAAKWFTLCAIAVGIFIVALKTGELPKK
jgi:hypothetical protein